MIVWPLTMMCNGEGVVIEPYGREFGFLRIANVNRRLMVPAFAGGKFRLQVAPVAGTLDSGVSSSARICAPEQTQAEGSPKNIHTEPRLGDARMWEMGFDRCCWHVASGE
jgi:hypothetical protein